MLNEPELRNRIKELDSKHYDFFKNANASTLRFIDIVNGKITFKTGIIIDRAVWQDINDKLEIGDKL